MDEAHHAAGPVDQRRARISRFPSHGCKESVREVGERRAAPDPIEPQCLERGAGEMPLEVEDRSRNLTSSDQRQGFDVDRLFQDQECLVRGLVGGHDPSGSANSRTELQSNMRLVADAVRGGEDQIWPLGEDSAALRAVDRDAGGVQHLLQVVGVLERSSLYLGAASEERQRYAERDAAMHATIVAGARAQ